MKGVKIMYCERKVVKVKVYRVSPILAEVYGFGLADKINEKRRQMLEECGNIEPLNRAEYAQKIESSCCSNDYDSALLVSMEVWVKTRDVLKIWGMRHIEIGTPIESIIREMGYFYDGDIEIFTKAEENDAHKKVFVKFHPVDSEYLTFHLVLHINEMDEDKVDRITLSEVMEVGLNGEQLWIPSDMI